MTSEEILRAIQSAIAAEIGTPDAQISATTTAADVPGWDSMAHARIVVGIERALGLRVDMDRAFEAKTVGDLLELILAAQNDRH